MSGEPGDDPGPIRADEDAEGTAPPATDDPGPIGETLVEEAPEDDPGSIAEEHQREIEPRKLAGHGDA
jgi:hypothetical protein